MTESPLLLRQFECVESSRHLDDDVLLALMHIRHHAVLAICRNSHLPDSSPRLLVYSKKVRHVVAALTRSE